MTIALCRRDGDVDIGGVPASWEGAEAGGRRRRWRRWRIWRRRCGYSRAAVPWPPSAPPPLPPTTPSPAPRPAPPPAGTCASSPRRRPPLLLHPPRRQRRRRLQAAGRGRGTGPHPALSPESRRPLPGHQRRAERLSPRQLPRSFRRRRCCRSSTAAARSRSSWRRSRSRSRPRHQCPAQPRPRSLAVAQAPGSAPLWKRRMLRLGPTLRPLRSSPLRCPRSSRQPGRKRRRPLAVAMAQTPHRTMRPQALTPPLLRLRRLPRLQQMCVPRRALLAVLRHRRLRRRPRSPAAARRRRVQRWRPGAVRDRPRLRRPPPLPPPR